MKLIYQVENSTKLARFIDGNYEIKYSLENFLVDGIGVEIRPKVNKVMKWHDLKKFMPNILSTCKNELNLSLIAKIGLTGRIETSIMSLLGDEKPCQKGLGLEKILDAKVTKIFKVSPLKLAARKRIEIKDGQICYVSFGTKKRLFSKYAKAYPGIVDSSYTLNKEIHYDVLLFKPNNSNYNGSFIGRFVLKDNEIGRTPIEAVKHSILERSSKVYFQPKAEFCANGKTKEVAAKLRFVSFT